MFTLSVRGYSSESSNTLELGFGGWDIKLSFWEIWSHICYASDEIGSLESLIGLISGKCSYFIGDVFSVYEISGQSSI